MPGQYAHMAVINEFTVLKLQELAGFPAQAVPALLKYRKYAELGSISPDFPFFYPVQKAWADNMHQKDTGKMIREGISLVAAMASDHRKQQKCFAWLCGYAAHVVTDVTVHPVVQLKSKGDSTQHRLSELNQDAYIWNRLGVGPIGDGNYFAGLETCFPNSNLDPDVERLWSELLKRTYPYEWAHDRPLFSVWHFGFKLVIERIASSGHAIPFGRHLGIDLGALYPLKDEINQSYIRNLEVPGGGLQDYDSIFDRAVLATGRVWTDLAKGVYLGNGAYQTSIGDWSLDTGRDSAGKLVFWS